MCGLVGLMSSNFFIKHKDALSDLLFLDTFRGRDSTGVAALRQNADVAILKSTVPGCEFVEGPKLDQHLKLNDFLWIGHNRYGTVGKNCKTNAHPFAIDDEDGGCLVVGAHNGTLKNKHDLTDAARFGTDSEALYNEIANVGIEEAIAKVEGAWALTYYDHVEEEFRVLRNDQRPLFYAWSEDKKTLMWASEMWMLRVVSQRRDIKLFEDKIMQFAEDTLYGFAPPMKMNDEIVLTTRKGGVVGKKAPAFFQRQSTGGGSGTQTSANGQPHTSAASSTQSSRPQQTVTAQGREGMYAPDKVWDQKQCKWVPKDALPSPTTSTTQSGTPNATSGVKQPQQNATGSVPTTVGDLLDAEKSKVVPILSGKTYKGFNGKPLTLSEIRDQMANGCSWCETEMIDPQTDKFAWFADSKPVCHKCLVGELDDTPPSDLALALRHN